MRLGIVRLYNGASGIKGYYNSQELGAARIMKELGYEVFIFIPTPGIKESYSDKEEDNISTIYIPARTIGVHSRFDWSILKEYDIDVVQLGADNQIFAPDIISYCDKNHILIYLYIGVTESDTNSKIKKIIFSLLFKRNIRSYKKHMCFAKTPTVIMQLEAYGIKKTGLAPVGLDVESIHDIEQNKSALRKKLNIPADKTVLLFVGRMDSYKSPLEAISLLKNLSDENYLIMIGDGGLYRTITKEIEQQGLATGIRQIRQLPNRDVQEYYVASDYFLNFNTKEIFGMSILEAMYHGCHVLAYHAPGPDYIIEHGISGSLCNSISEMQAIIENKTMLDPDDIKLRVFKDFVWNKTGKIFDKWIKQEYSISKKNVNTQSNKI